MYEGGEDAHLESAYEDSVNGGFDELDYFGWLDDSDDDRGDVYENYPAYADWE